MLRELTLAAGARDVLIHIGEPINPQTETFALAKARLAVHFDPLEMMAESNFYADLLAFSHSYPAKSSN